MKLKVLTQTEYLALIWGLFALATVFTVIRFTVRWNSQHRFYGDDWFALTSWFSLLTLAILYTANAGSVFFLSNYSKIYYTTGVAPDIDINELMYHYKLFAIVQLIAMLFFWTTLWAGKFSLLAFYRRLMEGVSGYMRWLWLVVVINVLTYLACFLSNFLTCLPMQRRWSPDPLTNCSTPGAIHSILVSIQFASGVDIATDLLIMMLPIPLIWGLRIPFMQKFGLAVIFCLGTIVMLFAVFRLIGVTESIGEVSYTAGQDLATWSMIECSIAVVVISLPALRGLLASKVSRTTGSGGYSSGSKSKGRSGNSGQKSGNIAGVSVGSQANSAHIKLHSISLGDKRDRDLEDLDGCSSQEELHRTYSGHVGGVNATPPIHVGPGINMTREVIVSSTPDSRGDGGAHRTGGGYVFPKMV